jgi:hypothetical protein
MSNINNVKESVEILQGILTSAALICGGAWTYFNFVYKRERVPRALVEPYAQSLLTNKGMYLTTSIVIKNIGSTLIRIKSIDIRIQQIMPIADGYVPSYFPDASGTEIGWPTIARLEQVYSNQELEIEPSETHEFLFDFLLPANIEAIKIYSFSQYIRRDCNELGWSTKLLYTFSHLQE